MVPVYADGDEVEYGGRAADDVQGDVEVAEDLGQAPHAPIHLEEREREKKNEDFRRT